MDTETDGQTVGSEGVDETFVQPSLVETPQEGASDDTAEQKTGTEETGQADETGDTPKRKPWWEKRFDELTAQRYKASEEAAYWRGIAEAGTRQAPQQQQPEGPPREEEFDTYDDYQTALIDYRVEQRIAQENARQQRTTVLRTYEERVAKAKEAKPDYDSVVTDPSLTITPIMAEVIRESDVGPEVAYHLGTNRAEAERIANLPPHRQAAELGKLEARLTAQPAPTPTPKPIPPDPPKTVAGLSAGINKSPEDMTMAEYAQWVKTRDQ